MSDQVITNLEQVTAEWLTAVLTRSGALTQGHVTGFDAADGRGNWSTSGSLSLHYSPDAQGERPSRLFLKMVDADTGDGEFFGSSEVDYYRRDYVDAPDAPLLRCYDGRQLMAAAEAEGRQRGCHSAYLDTFSFQAPVFYKQCGYEVFGTLEAFPDGHTRFFMRKSLS